MKKQAFVEVPLLLYGDKIAIPSPCACCGKPAIENWCYDVAYRVKSWSRSKKFGTQVPS